MSVSISLTLGVIVVCLVAALIGAFARWIAQRAALADWATFAIGLFFALLIFAAFKGG